MRVLDLTHTIAENMPVYPGTETPIFAGANTYEKDGFKETKLTMYTHTGTHMDPPAHLFAGRTTLDAFPASQFIGKALVIECSDLNEGKAITLERTPAIRQRRGKCRFSALPPRLGQALGDGCLLWRLSLP